ncbi:MAG TPA: LpqB family beta-propeller domain-containing protein [Gemmatimonadaceae bacterium]|nr:LpqB family beta-propeller domain-containing protein [Gemmatimonadaceae bacterium]
MRAVKFAPLVVAVAVHAQAAAPFTLQQILGYPFPTELVAAPTGAQIAWVFTERGVRNVYEAHGPDWAAHRVTRYTADDGQELTQLAFSRDGRTIVYVRGGDHGSNWEESIPPSPANGTVMPKIEIWAVRTAGDSAPRLLAEGDAPAISPKGDRVAFLRGGQAYAVPLGGGTAAQLFFARGTTGELTWSPSGDMLAFTSQRGDHAFLGIFTSDSAPVRYLAPSTSQDFTIRWSPDGKRIAFIRIPGNGGTPQPFLKETPQPWAIWTVDVASGTARRVWSAPNTLRGSYPETAGETNLAWGANDHLVFLSDVDGWEHLYSVAAAGGTPTLLTPGNFMVEHVAMSPDHSFLVYSANTGADASDDDRRHLFRISTERADASALTPNDDIQWMPVITGDNASTAFISAGAKRPPLPAVMTIAGALPPKLLGQDRIPAEFPTAQLVIPKRVTFKSPDGLTIHAQLFERGDLKSTSPGVIFIHGGPPRQMLLGWHYMYYYSNAYAMNQYLASRGFVVMTVNYRLGIGYGHDFHHPPHAGPWGAAEYQDVLAAGRHLASLPNVDPKRVGIWGGSYGGYLGALSLARNSDVFATAVDLHGVHDWVSDIKNGFEVPQWRYEKGDVDSAKAVAWRSSPVSSMATWRSPVLLIQGDDDRNVRFSQTVDLTRRLDAAGVKYELLVFPDEIHDFLMYATWVRADSATSAYLEKMIGMK